MKLFLISILGLLCIPNASHSQSFSSKFEEIESSPPSTFSSEINPKKVEFNITGLPKSLRRDFINKSVIKKIRNKGTDPFEKSLESVVQDLKNQMPNFIKEFEATGDFSIDFSRITSDITSNEDTLFVMLFIGKKDLLTFKRFGKKPEVPPTVSDFPEISLSLVGKSSTNPCELCEPSSDRIIYDFATNRLSSEIASYKWLNFRHPVVGRPFTFMVKNINPFRDSVIISQQTMNFLDSASLASLASFFSLKNTVQEGAKNDDCQKKIADVYKMGVEIKKVKSKLAEMNDCEDICNQILIVKGKIEGYFKEKWNYKPKDEILESFISLQISCAGKIEKDSVAKILSSYYFLRNSKNYFSYKIPQLQNVDEYIFNLSIIPKSGVTFNSLVDHQPIAVPLIGGFKIDASSGLFLTNLIDSNYTLRPDSTTVRNNKIFSQKSGSRDFGVAGFMHFYPRISTWFNISLSLGAGLSIGPNPKVRYLTGGSILLGRNGRLALNYGCALGFVQRLASGYADGTNTSISDASLLTTKVFKTSQFWSVSFSLPLFKGKINLSKAKVEEKAEESKDKEDDGKSEKEEPKKSK